MAQSYKKSPELAESYDAILIGTGIGCLCAGALLSKLGKKVLLLERHYTAGGFTHVLLNKGAKKILCFDVGYGQLAWKIRNNKSKQRNITFGWVYWFTPHFTSIWSWRLKKIKISRDINSP